MAAKVGTITNERAGIVIPIKLDRGSMTFEVEFMGKTYKNKDGQALEREVSLAIQEALENVVWTPVIRLFLSSDRSPEATRGHLGYSMERFYISQKADETWSRVHWNTRPEDRFTHSESLYVQPGKFELPCRVEALGYGNSPMIYLPYTEETWEKLLAFVESIHAVRAALYEYLRLGFIPEQLAVSDPRPEMVQEVS